MTKFNFPESIASRPVYGTLEARSGSGHLFVADAEGAEAILELCASAPEIFAAANIVFIPQKTEDKYLSDLKALNAKALFLEPDFEAAKNPLQSILDNAKAGLQVYLAGTESLMGQGMHEAMQAGIPHTAIQTEHRGSVSRRMQCVHCKGITEDVMTDPFVCSHCGLNLFVRDHYSRRFAAFQGVRVDAEDPGNVPPAVELYK